MDYRDHINLVRLNAIDNTIRSFEHLAQIRIILSRNDSARVRKASDLLRPTREPIDHPQRIGRRGARDVLVDVSQVFDSEVRPVNLHFGRLNRARTASTGSVRPASLSASPASIV